MKYVVLIALIAGVAHADDRAPVTFDQALAAVNTAPWLGATKTIRVVVST